MDSPQAVWNCWEAEAQCLGLGAQALEMLLADTLGLEPQRICGGGNGNAVAVTKHRWRHFHMCVPKISIFSHIYTKDI